MRVQRIVDPAFVAAVLVALLVGAVSLAIPACSGFLSPTQTVNVVVDVNRDGVDDRCPAVALSASRDSASTSTFVLSVTSSGSASGFVLVLDGAAQPGEVASGSKVGPLPSGSHTLAVQPVVAGVGSCPMSQSVTVAVP